MSILATAAHKVWCSRCCSRRAAAATHWGLVLGVHQSRAQHGQRPRVRFPALTSVDRLPRMCCSACRVEASSSSAAAACSLQRVKPLASAMTRATRSGPGLPASRKVGRENAQLPSHQSCALLSRGPGSINSLTQLSPQSIDGSVAPGLARAERTVVICQPGDLCLPHEAASRLQRQASVQQEGLWASVRGAHQSRRLLGLVEVLELQTWVREERRENDVHGWSYPKTQLSAHFGSMSRPMMATARS